METDKIIEFAPFIVVILMFFWQNNVFVKPEQLEKKHREILDDMKKNFVELNAYKEFQNHVMQEIIDIKTDINKRFDNMDKKIDDKFNDLKGYLIKVIGNGI